MQRIFLKNQKIIAFFQIMLYNKEWIIGFVQNFDLMEYDMEIIRRAVAGTMESSDAYVEIEPSASGNVSITLESVVEKQFGARIKTSVEEVLCEQGIKSASVRVIDRGALDCVIRARVETAILRAKEE